MKSILYILFATTLIASACSKIETSERVPNCVEHKIKKILDEPVWNPPAKVWKWEVDGDTYFYFTSDCCDQFNILYDDKCNVVCAPDGGYSGGGDGNCPQFQGEVIKTLIWEDVRE